MTLASGDLEPGEGTRAPQLALETPALGERPTAGLRSLAGRGTIVNAIFMVALSALTMVQWIVLARLLPTSVLGLWGLMMAAFMTILLLGSVGINDKYLQQDDADQERAFQIAFTLQAMLATTFVVVIVAGMPLFALVYDQPEITGPGMALALAMPALALQTPLWVHYRRMDFLRQRLLQAIDPVVTFAATLALVLAGLELWGLVLGAMAGNWVAALVIVRTSPVRLALRFDRTALREYMRFSWPLFLAAISSVLMVQVPVTVAAHVAGVSAVAGIVLAGNITRFSTKVDTLVTDTLYPAVCAVKDRSDLMFEAFWKSNRLALLWATPVGVAAALFAGDFVHYVIGEKWRFAVPLIAAIGLEAVISQIGFNWSAFFNALGDTRPLAVGSAVLLVAVMAIAVPLLVIDGVTGYGVGFAAAAAVGAAVRLAYLRRIFKGLALTRHVVRGIGPTVPAAAVILLVRAADGGPRSVVRVVAEAALYAALVALATFLSERPLLREAFGYLRRAGLARAPHPTGAAG